jgi:ABC-type protease/lipase transport system fused ATPase/permease subunit
MSQLESHVTIQKRAYYAPPWADVSIIGVAGSSGSGKSTLSQAIVKQLNLPWVVILSMARPRSRRLGKSASLTPMLGLLLQAIDAGAIQAGICQRI